jgi:hypothetical protein
LHKDKNVRVYAAYLGSRPEFTTQDVVVIYSDDNGLTWSPPVVAISGTPNINIPGGLQQVITFRQKMAQKITTGFIWLV